MADQTVSVRLRAVTSGFSSAMRSAAGSMSAVERNAGKLTAVGGALTKTLTPAMLGVAGAATAVGMQFESAMSGVEAVTNAGAGAMADMSAQAQELGRTTQFSASEAAGALEFLGMAGFSVKEATEALPETLSLAAAGGLELANAADLASNVLQQFALDVSETGRVTDVLAQTAVSSNTSVEQLGQAMQMAGPVANAAGLEIEETAAAIGAMGNAGIQASTAGTSLRGALTRLLNASGPAADTLDRLGINAERADGSIRPLDEIIDQLSDSGATAGDMMEIFGQRAGPAMAALVQQGGDSLRELTARIDDSAGAAERMADTRMDNLSGDLKELRSAAEGAGIALYEAGLGDLLRDAAQGATTAVQGFADLSDPMQNTVVVLGGIAAATGPAITGIGLIASKAPAIATNFRNGLTAMRRFSTFMMGPWGIAVAGATVALTQFWEQQKRVNDMTDRMREELGDTTPEIESLSDEFLIAELRQRDVLDAFRDSGLTLDDLRDAMGGSEAAQQRLSEAVSVGEEAFGGLVHMIPGVRGEQLDLQRTMDELVDSSERYNEGLAAEQQLLDDLKVDNLIKARTATRDLGDHMDRMPSVFNDGASAAADYEEGLGGVTEESDEAAEATDGAREALESYIDFTRRTEDPVFNLISALQDAEDAQDAYNDAVDEYGADSDEATRAALDQLQALGDLERAAIDGDVSFADFSTRLQGFVENGKMSEEQADLIRIAVMEARKETEDYDGEYVANLIAHTETAEERIARIKALIDSIPSRISTQVNIGLSGLDQLPTPGSIGGPLAGGGTAYRGKVHLVGEEGPELFAPGQTGTVFSAGDTRQMLSGPQVSAATGGARVTSSSRPVQLVLDGRVLAEAMIDPLSGEITSRSLQTAGGSGW